jgi:hypothetical protein
MNGNHKLEIGTWRPHAGSQSIAGQTCWRFLIPRITGSVASLCLHALLMWSVLFGSLMRPPSIMQSPRLGSAPQQPETISDARLVLVEQIPNTKSAQNIFESSVSKTWESLLNLRRAYLVASSGHYDISGSYIRWRRPRTFGETPVSILKPMVTEHCDLCGGVRVRNPRIE